MKKFEFSEEEMILDSRVCYKCIHFQQWEENCWCSEVVNLTWNHAPYCEKYEEKKEMEI